MAQITYANKTSVYTYPNYARSTKCTADDLNEIKQVVNENDSNSLYKNNTNAFIPTGNYNPVPKVYVDTFNASATFSWSGNYTLTTSNQQIILNETIANTSQNNEFTLGTGTNAGYIVIGANVNYIKISASVFANASFTANDSIIVELQKGQMGSSTILASARQRMITASAYQTLSIGDIIIPVQENDLILLTARNTTGNRGTLGALSSNSSYVTITKVA